MRAGRSVSRRGLHPGRRRPPVRPRLRSRRACLGATYAECPAGLRNIGRLNPIEPITVRVSRHLPRTRHPGAAPREPPIHHLYFRQLPTMTFAASGCRPPRVRQAIVWHRLEDALWCWANRRRLNGTGSAGPGALTSFMVKNGSRRRRTSPARRRARRRCLHQPDLGLRRIAMHHLGWLLAVRFEQYLDGQVAADLEVASHVDCSHAVADLAE